eukprot:TRINITY_DN841_c0_g1_i1.p1 TRINITY_DN841_c0_g1~~TRINITY_DN841_c0_g1_i1.p1  ORF type:complete len:732 (+),score=100.79 TRINITY_DN841_c0_g1_i1:33-2228(+)
MNMNRLDGHFGDEDHNYHDISLHDENENQLNVPDTQKEGFIANILTSMRKKKPPLEDTIDSGIARSIKGNNPENTMTGNNGDESERGNWTNQIEFFLSCLAYAVGIGNVWRFPYKCYKNGGGVFLIPYLIMLFLAALPLFYLELALGQFSQLGPNKIFGKIAPLFRGLGYGMLCISAYVSIYYNVIIAWCIYYMFAGFSAKLEWASCDNWYNTADCYTPELDKSCEHSRFPGGSTWWNNTCVPTHVYCNSHAHLMGHNHTHCFHRHSHKYVPLASLHDRISPAEEYFKRNMLMMDSETDIDNLGVLNIKLVGCLLVAWILVLVCLIKGVKSSGKVVWFTALFPYAVLVILLVRGVTLPGAMDGIYFFVTPDWSKLTEITVWTDAATQIFYSLGPGFGGLITLASYNKRNSNCQRDAVVIAIANSATSIFAGFVIFSILGFMAAELNVDVSEVVEGGTALAFVAYPTAITKLPVSPLWSFLFFSMLLTLGLDSQFTNVETLITAIYDEFPAMRKYKISVVGGVSLIGFLLGVPMCLQGGYYLFVLLDWYSGSWSLLMLSVAEIVLVAWIYSTAEFNTDLKSMGLYQNRLIRWYWNLSWKVTSPLLLIFVLIFTLIKYQPASDGDYIFPLWSNVVGWVIALSSVAITIPFGVYEFYKIVRKGWPLKHLTEFDYVWRTQSRALCEAVSNARSEDNRGKMFSPEELMNKNLLHSSIKIARSDEKVIMSALKPYKQ